MSCKTSTRLPSLPPAFPSPSLAFYLRRTSLPRRSPSLRGEKGLSEDLSDRKRLRPEVSREVPEFPRPKEETPRLSRTRSQKG